MTIDHAYVDKGNLVCTSRLQCTLFCDRISLMKQQAGP